MGLKQHIIQQDSVRLQHEDLIIKQVTFEKKQEIRKFMAEQFSVNEEGYVVSDITFDGIKFFRFMIEQLTNWTSDVKDMTDDELEKVLIDGDETIKVMIAEFNKICEEIAEEQKQVTLKSISGIDEISNSIDFNQKVNESLDNVSSKLGISREEVLKLVGNQNQLAELQKLLEQENKKKKPMDHKPKAKRARKKKSKQVVNLEDSIKSDELKTQLVDTNVEVVEDANI